MTRFCALLAFLGLAVLSLPLAAAPRAQFVDYSNADLFYSQSFTVGIAANPGEVDIAGVAVTEGTKFRSIGGNVGRAWQKLFDGKATFTFMPHKWTTFIGVNPDMIIKTIPGAHYLSYVFDVTSYLPIKNGKPEDPNISLMKIHVGDTTDNKHITRLNPQMLIKYADVTTDAAPGKKAALRLPDGTIYTDENYGFTEVVFHTSLPYWGNIIKRVREWFKKGAGGVATSANARMEMMIKKAVENGDYDGYLNMLNDPRINPEGTSIFWEIFKEFKEGVRVNTGTFNELFDILKDVSLSETVVSGLSQNGARSASMVYEFGTTLPFPNLEMFIKLLKEILDAVLGLPKIIIGLPKNDLRMAIVTRYISERFFEVSRVIVLPRDAAQDWYPPFLNRQNANQIIISADGTAIPAGRLIPMAAMALDAQ